MELQGTMFQYGKVGMVAFECPAQTDEQAGYLVVIGGLGDGFFATQYVTDLVDAMTVKGYSVVQVLMRSSYSMYGSMSLSDDVDDLDGLVATLNERYQGEHEEKLPQIILLGHSTGCQDIIAYLRDGIGKEFVTAAVLQAPVSDREYMMTLPETPSFVTIAQDMLKAGQGDCFLPRDAWSVPITAARYCSLAGRTTPDDMFSSDLTDAELVAIYEHITVPTLWVWGTEDEYMPDTIDKHRLGERIEWAIKCDSECLFIKGGNHKLDKHADQLVEEVSNFI
eukprot:Ihof_evm1s531 gene=Ihof_evmTU1s531